MNKETHREIGTSYLNLVFILLGLSLPALIGLAEFKKHIEILAARNQATELASFMNQSVVQSVLQSQEISLFLTPQAYALSANGELFNQINLPSQFTLRATPKTLHFYPSGASSPGRVVLSSKNVECNLTLSLRGRVRINCKRD